MAAAGLAPLTGAQNRKFQRGVLTLFVPLHRNLWVPHAMLNLSVDILTSD